jgi:hypothetical protein
LDGGALDNIVADSLFKCVYSCPCTKHCSKLLTCNFILFNSYNFDETQRFAKEVLYLWQYRSLLTSQHTHTHTHTHILQNAICFSSFPSSKFPFLIRFYECFFKRKRGYEACSEKAHLSGKCLNRSLSLWWKNRQGAGEMAPKSDLSFIPRIHVKQQAAHNHL